MLSKKRRAQNHSLNMRKGLTLVILTLLLWSRILSSYGAIQQVHASFATEINRGKINLPHIEDQTQASVKHINTQVELSGKRDIRLQKITEQERRADRIRNFYARWNSPMAAQAKYIVETADLFGMDFRLIPAISIVESSGGRYCFRPYNAFGWGKMGFASYEDSIYTVTRGLAYGYKTSDPYLIGPVYNPVTPDAWSAKVASLMNQI